MQPEARPVRTVYLVGVAGNPNLGDELIADAWLRYLEREQPGADVWLDTPFPGPAAALLAERHPRLHVTDTVFRLRDRALEEGHDVAEFITAALADPGIAPWWTSGIDRLRGADVVHLLGGGYANDMWPENFALLDALDWLAAYTPARVGATGLGLLPMSPSTAQRVADASRRFAVLDVRDAGTARALTTAPRPPAALRLTGDDVFLEPPLLDPVGAAGFDVGVVVQHDLRTMDWPDLVTFVERQVEAWGVAPDRIAVLECIPRIDTFIHADLAARWPQVQLFSFHQLWRDGFPAAPHQRWISTRFHPHLLAASAGARGLAISVLPKYYDAKHGLVIAAGSGWPLVRDISVPVTAELPVGTLRERAPGLRERKRETARLLYG
ncbi:polysaccharide pyruvyl transferase family protein [Georgenia faecalis]|uniref:polysaccharide pyruvyl transferase family protein n=1 Tax=Georgenia faecalis TaxID=2483799 RepID=UPI0013DEB6E7|nr:polysaccharide pyruvyl transferase family protein [Georgenia faecalis]